MPIEWDEDDPRARRSSSASAPVARSRPAYRPSGQTLSELREITTGPSAPSLMDQARDIVRAAPAGLAGLVGMGALAPYQAGVQIAEGITGTDGGFNWQSIGLANEFAESYSGTIDRLRNPSRYAEANRQGNILGVLLEDVGNVALVGGAASRVTGAGSRAAGAGLRQAAQRAAGEAAPRQAVAASARLSPRAAARVPSGITYQGLADVAGTGARRARVADALAGTSRNLRIASRLTNEAADVPFLPYRAALGGVRRAIPQSARSAVRQRVAQAVAPAVARTGFNPQVRAAQEAFTTAEAVATGETQLAAEAQFQALEAIDVDAVRQAGYGTGLEDGQVRRTVASAAMMTREGSFAPAIAGLGVYARRLLNEPNLRPDEAWRRLDIDQKRQVVEQYRADDGPGLAAAETTSDIGMPVDEFIPSDAYVLALDRVTESMDARTAAELSRYEVQGIEPVQRRVQSAYLDADQRSVMEADQEFQPEREALVGDERTVEYERRAADQEVVGPVERAVESDRRLVRARQRAETRRQAADQARARVERLRDPELSAQTLEDRTSRPAIEQSRRVEQAARRAAEANLSAAAEAVGLSDQASVGQVSDRIYNEIRSRLRQRGRQREGQPGSGRPARQALEAGTGPPEPDFVDAVIIDQALSGMLDPELLVDLPALRPVEDTAVLMGRGQEAVRVGEQAEARAADIDVEGAREAQQAARAQRVEQLREAAVRYANEAADTVEARAEASRQQVLDLAEGIDDPTGVQAPEMTGGERRAAYSDAQVRIAEAASDHVQGHVVGRDGQPVEARLPRLPKKMAGRRVYADRNATRPMGGDTPVLAYAVYGPDGRISRYVRVPDNSPYRTLLGLDGDDAINMDASLYDEWNHQVDQRALGLRAAEPGADFTLTRLDDVIEAMVDDPSDINGAVEAYIDQALTDLALEAAADGRITTLRPELRRRAREYLEPLVAEDADAAVVLDNLDRSYAEALDAIAEGRAAEADVHYERAQADATRLADQVDAVLPEGAPRPWEITDVEYADWAQAQIDNLAALEGEQFEVMFDLFFDADGNLVPHAEWVDTGMLAGRSITQRLIDPAAEPALVDVSSIRDLRTADEATRRLGRRQGQQAEAQSLARRQGQQAERLARQLQDRTPRGEGRLRALERAMRSTINAYRRAERSNTRRLQALKEADRLERGALRAEQQARALQARLMDDPRYASRRLTPAAQRAYAIRGDARRKVREIHTEIESLVKKGAKMSDAEVRALAEQADVVQQIADEVVTSITEIRELGERRWLPGEREALLELLTDPTSERARELVESGEFDLESFAFIQGGDPRMLGTDLRETSGTFETLKRAGRSGQEYAARLESGPQARTPEGMLRLMSDRIRQTVANDVRHHLERTIGITVEEALQRPLTNKRVDPGSATDPGGRLVAMEQLGYAPMAPGKQGLALDDVVVPIPVRDTFNMLQREGGGNLLDAWDVFNSRVKSSWLVLSPSWYLGNIVGNMMMGASEVGLGNYLRALPDALAAMSEFVGEENVAGGRLGRAAARRAVRRRDRRQARYEADPTGVTLEAAMRGEVIDFDESGRAFASSYGENMDPRLVRRGMGDITYETLQGRRDNRRMRRMGVTEARGNVLTRTARAIDDRYAAFAEGRYEANNYFDDLSRVSTFIAARRRPIDAKGRATDAVTWADDNMYLTGPDAAEARNMALRAVGDFNRMTPIERRYMRRIFSFYPWYKHATKLFFSLPMNHPHRVLWAFHLGQVFGPDEEDGLAGQPMPFWLGGTFGVGSGRMRVPGIPFAGPEELPLVGVSLENGQPDVTPAFRSLAPGITWPVAMLTGFDLSELQPVSGSPGSEDMILGDYFLNSELRRLWSDPDALAYWIAQQVPVTRTAFRAGAFDALGRVPGVDRLPGMGNLTGDPTIARYDTGEPIFTASGPIPLERPSTVRQLADFATGGATRVIPDETEQLQARRVQQLQRRDTSRRRYRQREDEYLARRG